MLRKLLGFLVAMTLMLSSIAAFAQTAPLSITLKPGQSMHDAVRDSMLTQRVAKLRADWAASHPGAADEQPTVAAKLTSGTILTPSVNVNSPIAAPQVSFSFTTGAPGISYIYYEFESPGGGQFLNGEYSYYGPLLKKAHLSYKVVIIV